MKLLLSPFYLVWFCSDVKFVYHWHLFKPVEPVLNGQPVLSGQLTIPQGWPFNTGLTVYTVVEGCYQFKSPRPLLHCNPIKKSWEWTSPSYRPFIALCEWREINLPRLFSICGNRWEDDHPGGIFQISSDGDDRMGAKIKTPKKSLGLPAKPQKLPCWISEP